MKNDVEDVFDSGVDFFNQDEYDRAIETFTKVLKMNPDHPDALYYRAMARVNSKDYDGAVQDFTQAIDKDSKDADSYVGRGETWERMGHFNRALADFKQALRLVPDSPDYRKRVGDMEKKIG